ncbi:MAG: hypothetical protein HY722_11450 [Planctomycetes bacterium]|nr:hypothetical protein [Planctomycetota bacterium]
MDVVSHALLGRLLVLDDRGWTRAQLWLVAIFGALPDSLQVPLYLVVGGVHERPWWLPWNEDWRGFREIHPYASWLWEVPHSLWFVLLAVVPLVIHFGLPRTCIAAYASHIVADVLTHHGEWATAPFFPLGPHVEGFWSAWDDHPLMWAACWLGLLAIYSVAARAWRRIAGAPIPLPPGLTPSLIVPHGRQTARTG